MLLSDHIASEKLISLSRLFLVLLLIGFGVEAAVMFMLPVVLPRLPAFLEAIVDASLLIFISAPLIWILVIRPLRDAALREKAHAAAVLSHTVDSIITLDLQGLITSCNPAAEQMFGFTRNELLGRQITHLVPEFATRMQPQEGNTSVSLVKHGNDGMELSAVRKGGTTFTVECAVSKVRLDGEPTLIAVARDITERKRTDEERRKLNQAMEQSPSTVMITDAYGQIEYVNPKFTEVTGYTAAEALGKNPRLLNSGSQSPEFYQEMWQTILHGEEWRGEFCNRKKSGELYWEHASISPVRNAAGRITHFVSVKEDVTQRKQTEKELQQAKEAAETANRAKSQFLANMSHELRTPLNGVLGYVQILQQEPVIHADQQRYVKAIQRCGEHLLTLINDVLDLAKIESGKLEVHRQPCNLSELLYEVHDVVAPKAAEKGLQFIVDIAPQAPRMILTDAPKLRQVLVNLLANAVKFTQKGSVTLHIDPPQDKRLRLQVSDTGMGIPPERLAEIFEPFTQLADRPAEEGTGLGLPISLHLVKALGGSLEVASQLNQGSCFTMTLPLETMHDEDIVVLREHALSAQRRLVLAPPQELTVLVADDHETNREFLVKLLQRAGIRTIAVASGHEAIVALRQYHIPVALLDIYMPVMGGIEATRLIRRDPALRNTVIILMSADVLSNFREQLGELRYDDFVAKPLRFAELLDKIARHTGVRFVEQREEVPSLAPPGKRARLPASEATAIAQRLRRAADIGNVTELNTLAAELCAQPGLVCQYGTEIAQLTQIFHFKELIDLADFLEESTNSGEG